jgi:hypothetical protein
VTNQLKAMVIEQMIDVAPRAGEEVIDAYDHSTIRQQPLTEVRTEEARPVPSRVVLEFGDAISGISRVSGQAARSIG